MKGFDDLAFEKHENEIKEKWGETEAYKEHIEKTKDYSEEKWNNLAEEMNDIFAEVAVCMKDGKKYDSDEVQSLVDLLQNHISKNYYNCTKEILAGLGQMYVLDERFNRNIDKHGKGTAGFISKAIGFYTEKN